MLSARKRMVARKRKGFTLLEILLVVGLLALLAAFAIPAIVEQGEDAKIDMAKAAIGPNGAISQPIRLFKFKLGQYPEELKHLCESPDGELGDKWKKPFLEDRQGLVDPWGNPYQYDPEGENNGKFDLWSMGPNGKSGDDDDICNWENDN